MVPLKRLVMLQNVISVVFALAVAVSVWNVIAARNALEVAFWGLFGAVQVAFGFLCTSVGTK